MPLVEHLGRSAPDYKLVSQRVREVLDENKILEPPVLPKEIAENYNLKVLFAGFSSQISDVLGFFDLTENQIVVNVDQPPNRQTFTIAHELGHALLHREYLQNHPDEYKVLRREPMGAQKNPLEQEANSFASNLLVPRKMLDKYHRIASTSELAKLFVVSEEVIRWRLWNEYKLEVA